MKKLFLSLSILTIAFSAQASNALIPVVNNASLMVISSKPFYKTFAAAKAAVFAGMVGYVANAHAQDQKTQTMPKMTKFGRVKNALMNVGSSVKTQVLAHPRIATGAGLATIAGLSYVAYKNFGKATVKPAVETKKLEVKAAPVVSTPTKAPKRRLPGGYARRR